MNATQEMLERASKNRRQPQIGGVQRGRPSDIDGPFDTREDGTTRTVAERIIDLMRTGLPIDTAASAAGQNRFTVRGWLKVAGQATIRQTADETYALTPHEQKCREFTQQIEQATAEYETNEWERHGKIAWGGGRITEVRVERRFAGPHDTTGTKSKQVETVKILPPDARAIEFRLAHTFPSRYGNRVTVAVEEPALSDEEKAESLAEQLSAYLEGRDDGVAEGSPESVPEAVEQAETRS